MYYYVEFLRNYSSNFGWDSGMQLSHVREATREEGDELTSMDEANHFVTLWENDHGGSHSLGVVTGNLDYTIREIWEQYPPTFPKDE